MKYAAIGLLITVLLTSVVIGVSARDVVELSMWENETPEWIQAADMAIEQFEHENPNIRVHLMKRPANMENALPVQIVGGTAPDVISFFGAAFKNFAMQEMLVDLTPYINRYMSQDELIDFFPGQLQFFKVDNMQFALPQYAGTVLTYYNATLFEEGGLLKPKADWTIDDMVYIGRKLTIDKTGDGEPNQWGLAFLRWYDRLSYWIRRWGGSMLRGNDPRKFGLDQERSLLALEALQDFIWTERIAPVSYSHRMQSGNVGLEENGPWQLTQFSGLLADVDFRLGVVEPPRGPAGRATMVSSDGYAVVAGTEYPEQSFRLVRFLAGKYASELRASIAGLQPARRSTAEVWLDAMPQRFEVLRGIDWGAFLRATEYAQPDPVFHQHSHVMQILNPAIDEIFSKGASVRNTVESIVAPIQAVLAE